MRESFSLFLVVVALTAFAALAEAQPLGGVPRIGFLREGPSVRVVERFKGGLRDLGYIEGENIVVEWRLSGRKRDRLPSLAAELVRLKVDVIIATGISAVRTAMEATKTIPIVMTTHVDPVKEGLVASLARPGGNVTGMVMPVDELFGKRLELLKEAIPELSRVAVLVNPNRPVHTSWFKRVEEFARILGLELQPFEVRRRKELPAAFEAASKWRAGALTVLSGRPFNGPGRRKIAKLAIKYRLPTIEWNKAFVQRGGLMSYGPDLSTLYRRALTYVDKIIKGARPGDLPVEHLDKFALTINLRTAKAIDLSIPPHLLMEAELVIK